MNRLLFGIVIIMMTSTTSAADLPRVEMNTSMGRIVLELQPEQAPKTVENFLGYVEDGFYDGTIFHRVIGGFMIQGGGFTEELVKKPTKAPIENEAANGLKNVTGSVAMARTGDPHSATAQFYINVNDNTDLDHNDQRWGYAVFGNVVEGMDVVEAIKATPTQAVSPVMPNLPQPLVVIEQVSVVASSEAAE